MKTVVAYCRSGYEPPRGPSPVQDQAHAIRQYALSKGLSIHETYSDAGASGISGNRPELRRLIADCKAGKIGTVVAQDPERLSRDTGQLMALLDVFRTTGVRVELTTLEGQSRVAFLTALLSAVAEIGATANA
jgi:DNA invertase Pin-like site-specific DNA recombinase